MKLSLKSILPYILAIFILALFITAFYIGNYYFNQTPNEEQEETNTQACLALGCPEGTIYVGSVNSDKYYVCDCHYADTILPENIFCFSSESEAIDLGYVKVEC